MPVILDIDDHALAHQVDSLDPADGGPGNDEDRPPHSGRGPGQQEEGAHRRDQDTQHGGPGHAQNQPHPPAQQRPRRQALIR